MSQPAMENELKEVLKQVEMAASKHRHQLLRNESATRTTLIDPILRELGWDVANPHKVVVEASARRGRNLIYADYGLFIRNAIEIVVEAKALGEDLRVHRPQVVDYAYAFNVNSVFLTNGLTWEHYNFTSFNPKALAPACILHLTNSNFDRTADYLKSVLSLQYENDTDQDGIALLHVEAEKLLTQFSVIVDQICESEFVQPTSKQLPTAALAAQLEGLRTKLFATAQPTPKNTVIEGLLIHWIYNLVNENGSFTERTTDLYERFESENAQLKTGLSVEWPRNASSFGARLTKTVSALRQRGIQASSRRDSKGITWTFQNLRTA